MAPNICRRPTARVHRSRGQALVEFALILPAFVLILAGILDFGFMLYARLSLVDAVREGGRWAVVQQDVTKIPKTTGGGLKDPTGHIGTNLNGLKWSDLTLSVQCVPSAGGSGCDFGTTALTPDAVKGDSVLISATYSYHSFFASFFGANVNLGTQVQNVLEVPTP